MDAREDERTPDRGRDGREPRGGGVFLMLSLLAGMIGGVLLGEPSIGVVVGLLVGIAILFAMWLADRRRA